ncbi:TonB family protein [Pleionea litopenaei]|uniref:TonB family protein n=1 Tax=Pleionea litopenaei TaxID=3070815 RepID=A0AA51X5L1_9GAMM|nr:TonB family protein [Pleionea sp. HL-JVS1]WMS85914.1 TonB family protein [Pleionea sp. HL-JVS1]
MKNIIAIFSVILSIGQVTALQEPEVEKAYNESDQQSQLNALYEKVNAHIKSKKRMTQDVVNNAKDAYELALKLNAKKETISAVGFLYIQAMGDNFNQKEKEEVLLRVYELDRGSDYFVDTGVELVRYYVRSKKMNKASGIAQELLNTKEDKSSKADLMLLLGNEFYFGDLDRARKYFVHAAEHYKETNNPKIAMTNFMLGKYYLAKENHETASKLLSESVEQFSLIPEYQKQSQIAESFLLNAYIQQGENELANRLCQKIGREREWDDGKDIEALYIVNPQYPNKAVRNKEKAELRYSFLVDTNGFAKNFKLIEFQGDKEYKSSFDEAAVAAIKNWRFAPKFEDGKSVEAEAYYTIVFKLAE